MERILIVEDDEQAGSVLSDILTGQGFRVDTADRAFRALDLLDLNSYDIVFSDIEMPGMDGIELVRRLVKTPPKVVPVLLTGSTTEARIIEAMRAGAFDFLSKPYTQTELTALLERACGRRRVLVEHDGYRRQLERMVVEREDAITGTNETLMELQALGPSSYEVRDMSGALEEFADFALSHLGADTFGIFAREAGGPEQLVYSDRFGRRVDRNALTADAPLARTVLAQSTSLAPLPETLFLEKGNQQAGCWPLGLGVFTGYLYMGYDNPVGEIIEAQRYVFRLFRNRIDAYLKEHYLVRRHEAQLRRMFVTSIQAHARSIEAKDIYTAGHCDRVEGYAELLARQAGGFSEDWIFNLRVGAILHDIGKIGVPSALLCKPGALTPEEQRQVQAHPAIGSRIVRTLEGFNLTSSIRHHHERFDGKGYPDRLKGEAIPMEARLILAADTFDAMTSNRPYRRALATDRAIEELEEFSGNQFDPEVVKLIVDAAPLLEESRQASTLKTNCLQDLARAG